MNAYLANFFVAFATSLLLTLAVRAVARRRGWVAKPRTDRWHKRPTALYGGVAIYGAFALSFFALHRQHLSGQTLLFACSSGLFFLGLVDDIVQLKPYAKLVGQIIFATALTMYNLRLHWLPSTVLDQALTIFWLVGITNALNLLDNLDGLSGGIAAIAAVFLAYFCQALGNPTLGALSLAFAGAVTGFLVFNFNPASIFMGDCGSLFLGFFLGGVALINNQTGLRGNVLTVLAIPVLLLLIPIVDTTLVTVNRKLHGRSVSDGGRDHTSHRLVALGLSERKAALLLWAVAAVSGAMAVAVHSLPGRVGVFIVPLFGMAVLFLLVFIGRVRVYEPVTASTSPSQALLPTLADFTYKRRVFEVLNDLVIIVLAYYGAFLLRFDGRLFSPYFEQFESSLPLVIVTEMAAFLAFGLYRGVWRYTSMSDLSTLAKAVGGGWLAVGAMITLVYRWEGFSRGVFVMHGVLLFCGIAGSRISFRLLRTLFARFSEPSTGRRVLIYGAGDAGDLLLRELQNNHTLGLFPIGFVDDDPSKQGRVIHGVRVLGSFDHLSALVSSERVEEVVISTSALAEERKQQVTLLCQTAGLSCRRLRISLE